MPLLNNGDAFPKLAVPAVGGGAIALPGAVAGSWGVVLIYRGAWCPFCNAQLAGYAAEKDALDGVLAAVREGLSGVIVLRGEAGVGKSALLGYVAASAADMDVAHTLGIESEMELGFAALHQVLIEGAKAAGARSTAPNTIRGSVISSV